MRFSVIDKRLLNYSPCKKWVQNQQKTQGDTTIKNAPKIVKIVAQKCSKSWEF